MPLFFARAPRIAALIASVAVPVLPLWAEPTHGSFGTPGLIDMPTAESAADADLSATVSRGAGSTRATLSFQITDRLSGSFRYSKIDNWNPGGALFDRSFDLRYRLLDEGRYRPAVAIGLQDIIGTGVYSGEYVVASKHLTPALTVTGGIGWGRLATRGGFDNPLGVFDDALDTRPTGTTGPGGQLESTKWFRGDAALFGGVAWQATDRLTLKAEYASDAYTREADRGLITVRSPVNLGASYRLSEGMAVQAYALQGSELGLSVTATLNPRRPAVPGGAHPAPLPVQPRPAGADMSTGWAAHPDTPGILETATADYLAKDGMTLEALRFSGSSATVLFRNARYLPRAEALGRSARILTYILPPSVETITLVPVENGMPLSAVTLSRSDIEQLEHDPDGAWRLYARARITDAADARAGARVAGDLYPRFTWAVGPHLGASLFDPDNPVRADLGLGLTLRYDLAPGLALSGAAHQRLIGNGDDSTRFDPSALPRVRSDANIYAKSDTVLDRLTLSYHLRPGRDLYARLTAGYLERMYAGVSGEILWKPPHSRLALGAELNHVQQRDFEGLGLRDYAITTGHVSAYYDMGGDFHGQIDLGRYLAGDWGGTVSIDREFANGWRIGAYATLTDVSADEFGEGSFDKGIRLTVPLSHFLGAPGAQSRDVVIQPILRDGGARVNVDGRLYETVRSYHDPMLRDSWGRFWR